VRKSLGYLQKGGDAEALIANARHYLVYNADEAHDYKFLKPYSTAIRICRISLGDAAS